MPLLAFSALAFAIGFAESESSAGKGKGAPAISKALFMKSGKRFKVLKPVRLRPLPGRKVPKNPAGRGPDAYGVKGPNEGKPCVANDGSTASSSHKAVPLECTVGGEPATCTCDMQCQNTCMGGKFETDCQISNCKVSLQGSNGGITQAAAQPVF